MPDLKIPGRVARLALLTCALLAGCCSHSGASPTAGAGGQVAIVVLPAGTSPADLAGLEGGAVGLLNPGLGEVSAQQTWLDVSQGARAFDTTYDTPLERVYPAGETVVGWGKVVRRARTTETRVAPGFLASWLARNGVAASAAESAGTAALAVARRDGSLSPAPRWCGGPRSRVPAGGKGFAVPGCPDPVTVLSMPLAPALDLAAERASSDLLIFIERPPAESGEQLTVAIAGDGFDGLLESPSTRTDGYVLATDIAPTVLEHFGLKAPRLMTGQPIVSDGELDPERLTELEDRYEQVGKRRGAALAIPLLLWLGLAALAAALSRGLYARPVLRLLCLSTILLPGVLLLTAALEPSLAVERGVATVLPVLIAAVLMRLAPGWRSLAIACGLTVLPYAVDMLAGSALTPRAVIGPNPGLGARFYGIGNELESTLMILTSVGCAATLTTNATPGRRAAVWFLAVGLVATVVFAAGRFGADVGAAIVFPVAAVVAAAFAAGRPKLAWVGLAAAAVALVLIGLADLVTGSETHYVRSVLGGSGGTFFEVIGHRLDATVESFTRVSRIPVTVAALAVVAAGVWQRQRVLGWVEDAPLIRAGLAGATAGSLIGAVTNDSGALFIQVGALYLALVLGFAWTVRNRARR